MMNRINMKLKKYLPFKKSPKLWLSRRAMKNRKHPKNRPSL
jgi:hypothetical protein